MTLTLPGFTPDMMRVLSCQLVSTSLSLRIATLLRQADVRVALESQQDAEDATLAVIDSVVDFIESNPPKWQEWKEKAQDNGIDWA